MAPSNAMILKKMATCHTHGRSMWCISYATTFYKRHDKIELITNNCLLLLQMLFMHIYYIGIKILKGSLWSIVNSWNIVVIFIIIINQVKNNENRTCPNAGDESSKYSHKLFSI